MSNDLAVMAKIAPDGGVEYLKARPLVGAMDEPVVGNRYLFCGMITSPVKAFEKAGDGWRVETANSVYLCWLDTPENAGLFAKSKGLADPVTHESGAVYWGFDKRPETYIL
jgi:hypothetical protein